MGEVEVEFPFSSLTQVRWEPVAKWRLVGLKRVRVIFSSDITEIGAIELRILGLFGTGRCRVVGNLHLSEISVFKRYAPRLSLDMFRLLLRLLEWSCCDRFALSRFGLCGAFLTFFDSEFETFNFLNSVIERSCRRSPLLCNWTRLRPIVTDIGAATPPLLQSAFWTTSSPSISSYIRIWWALIGKRLDNLSNFSPSPGTSGWSALLNVKVLVQQGRWRSWRWWG